ncbi:hypothetical protein N0V82_010143, partial [Gnomoniopsis sp. IMI 355080]
DDGNHHEQLPGAFEAEYILSVYHLVNWSKDLGGAGITPGYGPWKHVKSIFPIHNQAANRRLLVHLSKRLLLRKDDLDQIRDLFGSKVAFYFAFMQTYFLFLFFPAITGVLAWLCRLPPFSLVYAIVTLLGCTVFLEYWKIQQADLSMRWHVKGVGSLKVNRPRFRYEKTVVDAAGRTQHYYPKWKSLLRQTVQVPFFGVALVVLGSIIALVFTLETLISEAYEGPYKSYLEYLPTVMLAICLPYINTFLEDVTESLAEFENHRTQDNFDISLTQKRFVLAFIANYLPILLTAFVYIPLGDTVVPQIRHLLRNTIGHDAHLDDHFSPDPDRLRNEVIALTVTGQLSDMFEEMALPLIKLKLRTWWRTYQSNRRLHHAHQRTKSDNNNNYNTTIAIEDLKQDSKINNSGGGGPAALVGSVREQATLEVYNVQDDISEMVIQFGYLALFSPVWPLVSVGFLINNWVELRSDFLKLCTQHQRPAPVRTEGIGPWVAALDVLTWLGSISTAAIVHLFGSSSRDSDGGGGAMVVIGGYGGWMRLLVTVFVSEHLYLLMRVAVGALLRRIGSEQVRREKATIFAFRKKYLDGLEVQSKVREALYSVNAERAFPPQGDGGHENDDDDEDCFWQQKGNQDSSREMGLALIRGLKADQEADASKRD